MQDSGTNTQGHATAHLYPMPHGIAAPQREGKTLGGEQPIACDILYGADAIAGFLFGEGTPRRRVYHLVDQGGLPVFRIGATICARKSVLFRWITEQETAATKDISENFR